jgi:two-component system, cell cycle sensor histidine kinase and response regulator CckA
MERNPSDHHPALPPDFRVLFESSPGSNLVLAPNFTIVAVSDAYLRATMTVREAIVGRGLFDVFPDNPDDPAASGARNLRESLERVLRNRTSDAMPVQKYDMRRPPGEGGGFEERHWSPVNSPVFGTDGQVAFIIHHVEDVTEFVRIRKHNLDRELRGQQMEAEVFLRAQQLADVNLQLRHANQELARLHADLEARVQERTEMLTKTNAALQAEILERKRTEQALSKKREKLRVTLASIGDAVVVTDTDGRVTMLNGVAESLTGWTADEAIGAPLPAVFRIISQQTRQPAVNPVDRVMREGVVVGLANHTLLVARDGTERPIDDSAAPIRDESGAILGVVLIFRDVAERYVAEEALRRERTLLRTLIDALPDAIWTKDTEGRFVVSNSAHLGLVRAKQETEVAGKTGFDFHPPDLAQAYHEDDMSVLRDGTTILNKEEIVRDPLGVERWHLVIKTPLRDCDGRITGLVGISRNIQERKEAEQALRASERRLSAFFEATTAGVVEVSTDARILRANDAFCRMLGYPPAEMPGKSVAELVFPDEWDQVVSQYREIQEDRVNAFESDRRYRRKDGSAVWARMSGVVVRDEAKRPAWVSALVIDLTARKTTEDSLGASEERFRLFVEWVKDYAIFMTDPHGGVVIWNAGAQRAYGYEASEVLGRHASIFYPAEEVAAGRPKEHFAAGVGHNHRAEGWRVRKDRTQFWAEVGTNALRDKEGELRGFLVVARDLTDRRKLEEQFRHAQKMEAVGRLAGGVAHDFNNLLTVINGYSELLLTSHVAPDSNRDAIVAIRDAGERAAALTSQLLAFSRKAIVEPRILDLNEVVTQSTKLLRRLIGEDVVLSTALSPGLHRVSADPTQVEQVVMNLTVNARDAMPRGGRLTIETRNLHLLDDDAEVYPDLEPGHYVQLAVSDTGVGMTEEVKARVFEPFFTTKELGKGTGLGLSMVYGAVKAHGGHVGVYSELGVGTTFKILLPATLQAGTGRRSGEVRLAPRGAETILLAEDEGAVRRIAKVALETQGYRVLEAAGGADAGRVAADYLGPIHLLVTDVVMPGMSGRELAESLRVRHMGLKVLYMSGYTDDAIVRHGIVEATDAFLQKPFTPLSLVRKVRAVLDGSRE